LLNGTYSISQVAMMQFLGPPAGLEWHSTHWNFVLRVGLKAVQ
jgi:hypothetical protein